MTPGGNIEWPPDIMISNQALNLLAFRAIRSG